MHFHNAPELAQFHLGGSVGLSTKHTYRLQVFLSESPIEYVILAFLIWVQLKEGKTTVGTAPRNRTPHKACYQHWFSRRQDLTCM